MGIPRERVHLTGHLILVTGWLYQLHAYIVTGDGFTFPPAIVFIRETNKVPEDW
jgi:hypothetical protein